MLKSAEPAATVVGVIDDESAGISLTVSETVKPLGEEILTKADETTTGNLGSFYMYGLLGEDILSMDGASQTDKDNRLFINGAWVDKSGTAWDFREADTYKWRYGVHHLFWAFTPEIDNSDLNISSDFSSASFDFETDGTKDPVVAFTDRYYGNEDETDNKGPLRLHFYHALSGLQVNTTDVAIKVLQSSGGTIDCPDPDRVVFKNFKIRGGYDSGNCTVSNANAFAWDLTGQTPSEVDLAINGTTQFVIPQQKSNNVFYCEVEDTYRTTTQFLTYESNDVFGTGSWEAGHGYVYDLGGTVKVADANLGDGLNVDFFGKNFQTQMVIDNVSARYVKKVKLSWEGTPSQTNSANKSYVFMSFEPEGTTPTESVYLSGSGNTANITLSNVVFIYGFSGSGVLHKGEYDSATGKYWAVYEIPESLIGQTLNIYASYIGGSNGGDAQWHMRNLKLEVVEWR